VNTEPVLFLALAAIFVAAFFFSRNP